MKRFHSTLLLLLMTGALTACQTMPGNVSSEELELFTPLTTKQRIMNEVKVRWDVREDRNEFFFEDRQILVRRLSMDFGNRFLSDFVSDVRSHSHSFRKVMLPLCECIK